MVLLKLSLARYQDSEQDQGAVKGEEYHEKSFERVPIAKCTFTLFQFFFESLIH